MLQRVVFICALLILHPLLPLVNGYGEPDAAGRPVYQERANHVFLNAVRIAPSDYKTVYMAGYTPSPANILVNYTKVPPVYLEPKLDASAYAHSLDMATNNCFQHQSCDGTDPFVRIESYYTCSGFMAENIAAGTNIGPLDTNNLLLCDAINNGASCAGDKSGSDGHRVNIMNNDYRAAGVGWAYSASSTYKNYWTQDFGGSPCSPVPTTPIYGGSHYISGSNNKFIAVYYTSPATAPSTASVVIAGTSYALSLDVGIPGQATYATTRAKGTACQSYYFMIGGRRYPDTGCLVTYGEGTCLASFDASCTGAATAASATSSASATPSPASVTSSIATTSVPSPVTTGVAAATTTKNTATTGVVGSTTGSVGPYYLFSSAFQNSWYDQFNTGVTATTVTYSTHTALRVSLSTSSSTNFIMFSHTPGAPNQWTTLQFWAASASSSSIQVYFNNGYAVKKTLSTAWQQYSIPFSSLNAPASLGETAAPGSQLVFQNAGKSSMTLYLYNVAFV